MTGKELNHGFIPRDYDIFAGLDVDKSSISVTFLDHREMVKSMRIPSITNNLLNYVHNHFPHQKIAFAYEAGPTGYKLYDQLVAKGHPCLVVSPSMVPTAPGQRVKTNRLDSKKIAESLRGGQLKSIHVPTSPYRNLRHLVQLRDTFVRQATATKLRIKSLLLFEGIDFPEAPPGSQWSKSVIKQLKLLPCPGVVRFKLGHLLFSLEFSRKQTLDTIREIRRFCKEDPELKRNIELLMSIPGIGWIVASHLLARIGDPRYLRNVRELAGFFGLAPRENSTGNDIKKGSITRLGDPRLRNKLIQSAWASIQIDPELREFYRRVYKKHPKDRAARKAIVAVARKLTTRIFAVLYEQRKYHIRHTISVPLTQEETTCPRERLDASQKQEDSSS